MICELLGVPYEDHEFFQEHAGVTNARFKTPQDAAETTRELRRYISGLIEATMDDPAEDVLSDLAARLKEGDLSLAEATSLGQHILLVAGRDTSANMITLGTALLLQNPDQLAALSAADRDPPAFPEPEKLDLARRAAQHVAFSWGSDQCIGQRLARIELHIVFSTLFRRVPTLRLAVDVSELKFKEDSQAYGIYELPVTWWLLEIREGADTTKPSSHRREDGLRPAVKLVGTTGFEPATP
ncbi:MULTISPECIES: cytochrome P450 [Streptomyces]|uniref:cytochrome P450 n=1 Tax=Streptomyces TaxID=1883 RepID=UPI002251682B|nr:MULTISPECIES: cytochrome P450 [Streptomyces]MCX4438437.1 cytochrome P450 [Streptomyces mirabilis]